MTSTKTPEEMAEELDRQAVLYVSLKARNDVSYHVGMDCYRAGYKAAQEEAEAKIASLRERLADITWESEEEEKENE